MPPDKVKLSPESKRTFLEIGLKHIVDKQESASEEQKKSLLFSFVKMLCFSPSYLYCSRIAYFDIYRLNLLFGDPGIIYVYLASKDYDFCGKSSVSLTYDSVHKLIKLLLPFYISTYFAGKFSDANVVEKYLDLLKLTKGKIGLNFNWHLEKEFMQKLLKTFASRTYVLNCDMDHFEAVELLQFPVFDRLVVYSIANSRQILRVLKCKAKNLELRFFGYNFTIDDSNLDDLKNETIEKLHLTFREVDYVEIEKTVKQLHKCCSNLKHFDIYAIFDDDQERVPSNQVYDCIITRVQRMNELKACYENGLVNTHINFHVTIHIDGERDNTWIKRICENSKFKQWKFESHEKIVDADGDTTDEEDLEAIDLEYHDILEIKFDDARCKLKMTVKVITPEEDEDQTEDDDDE